MSQKSEEIDLISVFNSIKVIVVKLVSTFFYIIKDSIFSFKRLFALLSICLIIGIGLFFVIKPAYKSQMIIEHKRLNNDQCAELINILSSLSNDKQSTSLAKVLSLSNEEAENIKSINYLPLNDRLEKLLEDSVKVITPFKIEVEIYKNSILPAIQYGILQYLNNNEYAQKREKTDLEYMNQLDLHIKKQLFSLDTLKTNIIENLKSKKQISSIYINQQTEIADVFEHELILFKTKFDIEKNKQLNSSFELIQGFNTNNNPYNSEIKYNIVISLLIGYMISFLISTYKTVFK